MKRGSKPTLVKRRRIKEAVRDQELLCIREEYTDMGSAKELCDKRVAELKKSNGTLDKVSSY